MVITKSVIKKKRIHILSIWIYVKVKDENGKYKPVCSHYSTENKFGQPGSLQRQLTMDKAVKVQSDFSEMTEDDISVLPTQKQFIKLVGN
jgi:hypothetical protein